MGESKQKFHQFPIALLAYGSDKDSKLDAIVARVVEKAAEGDMSAVRHVTRLPGAIEDSESDRAASARQLAEADRKVLQGILKRLEGCSREGENEN